MKKQTYLGMPRTFCELRTSQVVDSSPPGKVFQYRKGKKERCRLSELGIGPGSKEELDILQ